MILPNSLRHAVRSLSKSPGFFFVATACLGLALALNTTTFAILDAMLHPSLPVKDPGQLFSIRLWGRMGANDVPVWERYQVLRSAKFYQDIAFVDLDGATVRTGSEVYRFPVCRFSSSFYSLLGVKAEIGRLPGLGSPEDVAVVSHAFWERSLDGRSLDRLTLWVNGREYRVIGVLPSAAAALPFWDVAVPLPRAAEETGAGVHRILPIVRVRRGLTREALVTHLTVLARRLSARDAFVPYAIAAYPHEVRQIHFAMAGAALLVLLIACGNLAGLMLVRGAARRREVALRLALGAGRRAVVRQLLTEAAAITMAGTAAGLAFTLWAISILRSRMPPSVATLGIVTPQGSWRLFAFGGLAALGTMVLIGLWPAIRASDVDVSEPLKDSGTVTTKARWRYHPVVVAEVALSLVLLMGVTLLTKAAGRLSESLLGFDRQGLMEARVELSGVIGPDSVGQLSQHLLGHLAALPDVRSVALVGETPTRTVTSEYYDGVNGIVVRASVFRVSDRFLRTLGVPVLQGRDLAPGDEGAGAVVVDEAAALALWPDGRAVGRLIKVEGRDRWVPVVGMARRALAWGPQENPALPSQGTVYQAWQPIVTAAGWELAIRTPGPSGPAAVALRHAIGDALPGARVLYVQPWLTGWDTEMDARYFLIGVFAAFGAFALALAAVGLYGVVSYAVSQRMREFAVRVAVGAPRRDMMKLVARDAAVMTLAGIGLGAFLAMWGSTLLGEWLYDVYHTDARSLVLAELVLVGAAGLACLHPALRALRADPVEILRAI